MKQQIVRFVLLAGLAAGPFLSAACNSRGGQFDPGDQPPRRMPGGLAPAPAAPQPDPGAAPGPADPAPAQPVAPADPGPVPPDPVPAQPVDPPAPAPVVPAPVPADPGPAQPVDPPAPAPVAPAPVPPDVPPPQPAVPPAPVPPDVPPLPPAPTPPDVPAVPAPVAPGPTPPIVPVDPAPADPGPTPPDQPAVDPANAPNDAAPPMHDPPTNDEIAALTRFALAHPPARQDRPGDPVVLDGIRAQIAVAANMGTMDQMKDWLRGADPAEVSAALDAPTLALVQEKYSGASPEGRKQAAWLLGKSSAPGVVPFLASQLAAEPDAKVRSAIVGSLAGRGDGVSAQALVQALATDPDETIRAAAADALSSIAGKSATARQALVDRVGSKSEAEQVRAASARALGSAPSPEASKALQEVVGGDSPAALREAAAWSLMSQTQYLDATWIEAWALVEKDTPLHKPFAAVLRKMQGLPPEQPKEGCSGRR